MRIMLTVASAATALALSVYLYRLAARTAFFEYAATVGDDVAAFVTILCVAGVSCSLIATRLRAEPRWLLLIELAFNGVLSLTYLILYVVGKFVPVGLR